ncbi:hypothetical protein KIPB_006290, partial [Kipferlia bialata]|eukprot:g6290.t1
MQHTPVRRVASRQRSLSTHSNDDAPEQVPLPPVEREREREAPCTPTASDRAPRGTARVLLGHVLDTLQIDTGLDSSVDNTCH